MIRALFTEILAHLYVLTYPHSNVLFSLLHVKNKVFATKRQLRERRKTIKLANHKRRYSGRRIFDGILLESDMIVSYGSTNLSQGSLFWHHKALPSDV